MTRLSVNVNKVATLRNTRTNGIPSVVKAARLTLDAGAHGITVHPRPDQRHIRPNDVFEIAQLLEGYPHAEFNIEGNPFHHYLEFVEKVCPMQCTLVPDSPDAFTSNHGWDLRAQGERLRPVIDVLHRFGCRVSLFMDPVLEQVELASQIGADRVELYTEPYAKAFARGETEGELPRYVEAARRAHDLGLGVNAGHDLNLDNLPTLLAAIPFLDEVSIGHALIGDALEFGLPETVRKYLAAVGQPTR
ncbi:MAG: pyridoxine 5'-phosphate synthase [Planctomycetes bacterium]|nr:pyridoxine 5'-phosphate synthase [Planctomycetota bacterium]